jgi:hypothetical protein
MAGGMPAVVAAGQARPMEDLPDALGADAVEVADLSERHAPQVRLVHIESAFGAGGHPPFAVEIMPCLAKEVH